MERKSTGLSHRLIIHSANSGEMEQQKSLFIKGITVDETGLLDMINSESIIIETRLWEND